MSRSPLSIHLTQVVRLKEKLQVQLNNFLRTDFNFEIELPLSYSMRKKAVQISKSSILICELQVHTTQRFSLV